MRIIPAIFLSLAAFTTSAKADTCSGYQSAAVQKIREEVRRLDLLADAMGKLGFKAPDSLKGYYNYLGLLKSSFERGLDVAENAEAAQAQYAKLMSNREARCTLAAAKQWGWQAVKTDPQVRDDIDICLAAAVSRYQADAVALTLDWNNPDSVIGGLVRQWTGQCSAAQNAANEVVGRWTYSATFQDACAVETVVTLIVTNAPNWTGRGTMIVSPCGSSSQLTDSFEGSGTLEIDGNRAILRLPETDEPLHLGRVGGTSNFQAKNGQTTYSLRKMP